MNFTDKFEDYALDQFPFRSNFRQIKTYFNLYGLQNKDNNKYVKKNDYIYKLEYPTNYKSLDNFINMINKIKTNSKVYVSVIPDKSYFLSDDYLKLDYDTIFDKVSNIDNTTYIPLNDVLKIEDYYKTDTHWKQSKLFNVVDRLATYMNFTYTTDYVVNKHDFKGVYYGQLGLNLKHDTLEYLTNDIVENASVYDIEHVLENKVYNINKLDTIEPYDTYLNGSTPLITITNNNSNNDAELIIFRDSFASSIAPLLIGSYKKVTLVDLRYIDYNILSNYLEIKDQDILFLYSTLIINNSNSLKY